MTSFLDGSKLKYCSHIFLNWLFPQSALRNELELMTPAQFTALAHRPLDVPLRHIHSLFDYKEKIVSESIWMLKYKGDRAISKLLASLLYERIIDTLSDEYLFSHFDTPLLVPIPLSSKRLKERGWNQSELIALELEKIDAGRFFIVEKNVLQKIKHTSPQTKLNRAARLKNLKDCFALSPLFEKDRTIKGRNIILIDDVSTTGSTFHEAMRVLYKAGARNVIAFSIAH